MRSTLIVVLLFASFTNIQSKIEAINKQNGERTTIDHTFQPYNPQRGVESKYLMVGSPLDGCSINEGSSPYAGIPDHALNPESLDNPMNDWILLISNEGCILDMKIKCAQAAGFAGIIVYNTKLNTTTPMRRINFRVARTQYQINISFVGRFDGERLKNMAYPNPYLIKLQTDDVPDQYMNVTDDSDDTQGSMNESSSSFHSYAKILIPAFFLVAYMFVFCLTIVYRCPDDDEFPKPKKLRRPIHEWRIDEHIGCNMRPRNWWVKEQDPAMLNDIKVWYRSLLDLPLKGKLTKRQIKNGFSNCTILHRPDLRAMPWVRKVKDEVYNAMCNARDVLLEDVKKAAAERK